MITLGRRYGATTLPITVLDDQSMAIDLDPIDLRFVISRDAFAAERGLFLIEKTHTAVIEECCDPPPDEGGITVDGEDDNVAIVAIAAEDYENMPSGFYYGELRDMGNNKVYWPRLGEDGDIQILPGSPPAVEV